MSLLRNFCLGIIPVIAILSVSCSKDASKDGAKPQDRPAPVTVINAVSRDVPFELSAVGLIEASASVAVKSQVGGQLVKIHFREGQDIRKGDLLFTIDKAPYEIALKRAEAALQKDKSQLQNARADSDRYADLFKKGYVSEATYLQARTTADSLEASANADVAAIDGARLDLSHCSIYASVTGRTGSLVFDEGNLIKANDDRPMVVIEQVEPLYVSFALPESKLTDIRDGMKKEKLAITVSVGGKGSKGTGYLSFIDNVIDRTTGTIKLKGTIQNADKVFWPGQFVTVRMALYVARDALIVPTQAVQSGQKGQYVYIVKPDMTAELRPVKAGWITGVETVIKEGILPGETVVVEGHLKLVPGKKVEIKGGPQSGKKES